MGADTDDYLRPSVLLPEQHAEPRLQVRGTFLSGELNGEDCKNSRPQEGHGHSEIDGLPEVRQGNADRQAGQRPRSRRAGRDLHLLLRLRIFREVVGFVPGFRKVGRVLRTS